MAREYQTFSEFYPLYLSQHRNRTCRRLHVIGSGLSILLMLGGILIGSGLLLLLALISGYGLAWIGHFYYEKNKPATFNFPWYSLKGDFVMFKEVLSGKIPW